MIGPASSAPKAAPPVFRPAVSRQGAINRYETRIKDPLTKQRVELFQQPASPRTSWFGTQSDTPFARRPVLAPRNPETQEFQECRQRGQRLLDDIRRRWLQRRQAALAPALRRRLGLAGPDARETQAQQAAVARNQGAQRDSALYQNRYRTDIDPGRGGAMLATSRYSERVNSWELAREASFENSFYPVRAYPSQPNPEMLMVAEKNFNRSGIGIRNSEVLFLQSRDAGFQQRLRVLQRQHVTNATTRAVTGESFRRHGIDPSAQNTRTLSYTRLEGGDLFAALLGTPNGRAAAFLVLDHGEDLGVIGIERIEHLIQNGEEHVFIYFTPDERR